MVVAPGLVSGVSTGDRGGGADLDLSFRGDAGDLWAPAGGGDNSASSGLAATSADGQDVASALPQREHEEGVEGGGGEAREGG